MTTDNLWYKDAVFYQIYIRAFYDTNGDGHGDLNGVTAKLEYLKELGIDCIWLMPFYPSPLKDDGYDIADYYNIHPDFGTLSDFRLLVETAHSFGIRVITDLVLNHTSDQHTWFQSAVVDKNSPFRNYYVWSDTDQKYREARIIFLDTEKSNWTWHEKTGQYYWHRFYASQPDLNFDNPAVQEEMINVMRFWLDLGVDGFRADAVPYLFEREGTNCENLSETHAYLKRLRKFIDENYPGRILLCEANQWPEDVRPYFGDGDEFHMGFHFPVMPRIYMGLRKGSVEPIRWILERTPSIPESCQWCTFLRNHDELTLEMVTEDERQWMWAEYAPDPNMRINLGIRRRLAPLLDHDRRKIELANSLLFTLPGSPIIYYGDEIGMGDNIKLFDRNGVRTPMQWTAEPGAGFSTAPLNTYYAPTIETVQYSPQFVNVTRQWIDQESLLHLLQRMISIRKEHLAFGRGDLRWLQTDNPAVAAYLRTYRSESLLFISNLSLNDQTINIRFPAGNKPTLHDLIHSALPPVTSDGAFKLILSPCEYRWFSLDNYSA